MKQPNVLVVQGKPPTSVLPDELIPLEFPNGVPNIKKHRAYYLTFMDDPMQRQYRVYHILRSQEKSASVLEVLLGISFLANPVRPMVGPFTREYQKMPLTAFGLHQIAPGTLIAITSDQLIEGDA